MNRSAILLAIFCAAAPLGAQEPVEKPADPAPAAPEKPATEPATPEVTKQENPKPAAPKPELPTGDPAKPGEPDPSLLPGDVPLNVKPADSRVKNRSTLKAPTTATDLDLRIRYRQAQTKASADTGVQAAWTESRKAVTDYDKRAAMRRYYTLLFKKMLAVDKGIAPLVDERQRYSLHKLDQTRVDPTDPIENEDGR